MLCHYIPASVIQSFVLTLLCFLSTWFSLPDLSIILRLRFLLTMSPKISFIYHFPTELLSIFFCSPHPSLMLLVSSGNLTPKICKVCHLGSCRSCRRLEYFNKMSCWQVQDMHTYSHSTRTHTTLQYNTVDHTLTRTTHTLTYMYTHTHAHASEHHVPQASYHGNYSQVITWQEAAAPTRTRKWRVSCIPVSLSPGGGDGGGGGGDRGEGRCGGHITSKQDDEV